MTNIETSAIWNCIRLSVAAGGLAAAALLSAATPAAAKQQQCFTKLLACEERCVAKEDDRDGAVACGRRTCYPQYNNCVANGGNPDRSGGGPKGGAGKPKFKPKPRPKGGDLADGE